MGGTVGLVMGDAPPAPSDTGPVTVEEPITLARRTERWIFAVLLAGSSALLTYDASTPGFMTLLSLLALLIWVVLGVAWLARLWRYVAGIPTPLGTLVVPALVVIATVALCQSPLPLQLRFDASRSSFDAARVAFDQHPESLRVPDRIGSYDISTVEAFGPGTVFAVSNDLGLFNDAGFAYFPPATTASLHSDQFESPTYVDLGGGWWAYTARW